MGWDDDVAIFHGRKAQMGTGQISDAGTADKMANCWNCKAFHFGVLLHCRSCDRPNKNPKNTSHTGEIEVNLK